MAQMFFSLSGLCSCMFFVLYPFVFGLIRLVGYRVEGCRSSVFFSLPVLILLCLAFSLSRLFCFDFILYLLLFFFLSCVFPSLSINLAAPQFFFLFSFPCFFYLITFAHSLFLIFCLFCFLLFSPSRLVLTRSLDISAMNDGDQTRDGCNAHRNTLFSFDFNAIIISIPLAT